MEKKLTVAGIGLALVLGVVGLFTGDNTIVNPVTEKTVIGGVSSDSSHKFFGDGITVGGQYLATTSSIATYTLVAQEVVNKTVIEINPSVDLTLRIGATSTAQLVPRIGDTASFILRNASTTVAATITVAAADSSTDLQENQGGNLVLAGLDSGRVTLIRKALSGAGQVIAVWEEFQVAD